MRLRSLDFSFLQRCTASAGTTLVALLGAAVLVACGGSGTSGSTPAADPSGSHSASDRATGSSAPVLQPGSPGEPMTTIAPEDAPTGDPWNHTDVAFVQMMIPHHAQALVMARLAPDRAHDPEVKALAARIEGAQGPEIVGMAGWLEGVGVEVPRAAEDPELYDHGAHGHQAMVGMLGEQQMAALEAAHGARFDRLFLRGMIAHHEGAIEMADSVLAAGSDPQVIDMANDVVATQSVEIERMQRLLERL